MPVDVYLTFQAGSTESENGGNLWLEKVGKRGPLGMEKGGGGGGVARSDRTPWQVPAKNGQRKRLQFYYNEK